jgi:glutamate carboxypeptidase
MVSWVAMQEWLDHQQAQMADELQTLCDLNSGSDSVEGLKRTANWLEEYMRPVSDSCRRIVLPDYQKIDDQGTVLQYATGPALAWELGVPPTQAATRVLMTIHYDTVYGPENAFQRCIRFEQRRPDGSLDACMRGPGVIDAKGGIVILRWSLLAAKKFLDLSPFSVSVLLTPDEEIGSPSSSELWGRIAGGYHVAMLFEPAMADGALVSHRKGTGNFTVVVRGRSAHAGRNFHEGRNAVVHASKLAIALNELNGQRPNVTINIGRLRGGDAVNVVPDLAVLRINVRVNDREDQVWIVEQVQSVVQRFQVPDEGFEVVLDGGLGSPPKVLDEAMAHWMKVSESAAALVGQRLHWNGSGGASDGNKLAALGLSNVDTFGPEGGLLHSDQEWIRLSSLPKKAALTAAFLHSIDCREE